MGKKITTFSIAILAFAVSIVTAGFNKLQVNSDVTYAGFDTCAVEETASTTESLGDFVSNKVDSVTDLGGIIGDVSDIGNSLGGMVGGLGGATGGMGDAFSGIGDALGGLLGGLGSGSSGGSGSGSVTYDVNTETIGYIDVVPAVSDFTPAITSNIASTTQAVVNETVDFAATQNPYAKPTGELKGGDKGDGVKWMQWMFIYTRYGLKDDGITGVFDEDTMAVVKKLQKENGLAVDGIVDDEVIDKIELLYFQATYTTTAPAVATQTETQPTTVSDSSDAKGSKAVGMVAIVIIIILIWLFAVGAIVALFLLKKRKGGKKKPAKKDKKSAEKPEAQALEDDTVIESASFDYDDATVAEMFDERD